PAQTHYHFDMLLSMERNPEAKTGIWLSSNFHTYMLLKEGASRENLESKFSNVYEKYYGPQLQSMAGISYQQAMSSGGMIRYYLQPIEDIHLESHLNVEMEPNSRLEYIYLFSAIGIFLIIIASINFINISTARASTRAKEIGVKKVMGSFRRDLVIQFLTESVFQSVIAAVIALVIVFMCLPLFNIFVNKEFIDPIFGEPVLWWKVLVAAFGIGLLAGVYPSLYLSGFSPVDIMRGKTSQTGRKSMFRNVLVVFQFATSLVLIIGTLTVYNQLNHIKNQDLGYDREQVLLIENSHSLGSAITSFKEELKSILEVKSVSNTGYIPSGTSSSDSTFEPVGAGNVDDPVSMQFWAIDPTYLETFGMELIDGRTFEEGRLADSSAMILNETAARRMGLEDPVGKKIRVFGDFRVAGQTEFTIVGVIKDFNYKSLHQDVGAMGLYLGSGAGYYTAVKTSSEDYSALVDRLESTWDAFSPSMGFSFQFLDSIFDEQYRSEQRLGEIFMVFASLALFIGCLGLFGLSAYTAEQRRKEIGVRKVLGASTTRLIGLLLGDFTKLLLIAIVLAVPISWMAMDAWLDGFAYRVTLGPTIFILGSIIALLVAWLTVSYQSTIAARANPAKNLKYE
ncbi:MAG: FtsX-like permease family protein, partial [Bacteroidota bacterium]